MAKFINESIDGVRSIPRLILSKDDISNKTSIQNKDKSITIKVQKMFDIEFSQEAIEELIVLYKSLLQL